MKKAFTLAEVLTVLGIIGVIAILTVPSIVKNYKYRVYAANIEKTYSQINDAIKAIMTDELTDDFYQTTGGTPADENCEKGPCYFLTNYFKSSGVDCNADELKCVAPSYQSINGEDAGIAITGNCIKTINNVTICIVNNHANHVSSIFVDTTGPDAPNVTGLDAFVMDFRGNKLVDWSEDGTKCNTKSSSYGHVADYATGCLANVMNAGWKITY